MNSVRRTSIIVATTGLAGAAHAQPTIPSIPAPEARVAGHIYYNIATGERVVTPIPDPARDSSAALWLNNNTDPCNDIPVYGLIDDPDIDGDGHGDYFFQDCATGTFPCEGAWVNWWGDVPCNSVIDCITVAYYTEVPDPDLDSDFLGDGVVGYDLILTFSDNDNGHGADGPGASGRSCILDLAITTLPGFAWDGGHLDFYDVYFLTIDFTSAAPSLVFELGDSDGIDNAGTGISGGAIYGHPTGVDRDDDGRADFSYAMRFDQSALGTSGQLGMTKGASGFVPAAPKLGNPGDLPPDPADAMGLFDGADWYTSGPSCPPTTAAYIGTFSFGGFTCELDEFNNTTPHTSAYLELYQSSAVPAPCQANFDGSPLPADFVDVIYFLTDFAGACTDGIGNFDFSTGGSPSNCDFNDISAFLTTFASADCQSPSTGGGGPCP